MTAENYALSVLFAVGCDAAVRWDSRGSMTGHYGVRWPKERRGEACDRPEQDPRGVSAARRRPRDVIALGAGRIASGSLIVSPLDAVGDPRLTRSDARARE